MRIFGQVKYTSKRHHTPKHINFMVRNDISYLIRIERP